MNGPLSAYSTILPPKLKPGDRVRFVSPASTPKKRELVDSILYLRSLGLMPEIGKHALDKYGGYFAGTDEDRLADLNEAFRDPDIKAVITTRGGKGAYRIADSLDFEAATAHPKLLIGFSEITILHMALYKHCSLAAIHGATWGPKSFSAETVESFLASVFTTDSLCIETQYTEPTALLTTNGKAEGVLLGGNQTMLATAAGWALPSFENAILLLEAVGLQVGQLDRQLTMLINSGSLKGVCGVAIGQYIDCGPDAASAKEMGKLTAIEILKDRLSSLDVPILGGLPIGHGENPRAVPIGTMAILDADKRRLTVSPAVR